MHCPKCAYFCPEFFNFCPICGEVLNPAAKKGRHWVPILIMVVLSIFCTGLFFAFPGDRGDSGSAGAESCFTLDDGILYFHADRYDGGTTLSVPAYIDGSPVTAIAENCFLNCTELKEILLPDTLQEIRANAFRGCTALRGIQIPEAVTVIGTGAFSGCSALEAISISGEIQIVGSRAFDDCPKLYYIYFSGSYELWTSLYPDFITPYTVIFAENGSYYQGGAPY